MRNGDLTLQSVGASFKKWGWYTPILKTSKKNLKI
jgi:hypothetical protein